MRKNAVVVLGLFAFILLLCVPFATAKKDKVQFLDVTKAAKITFRHVDGRSGQKYYVEPSGAGAAFFDYDNDADLDIYFVNGATLPGSQAKKTTRNVLYRNNLDGTFTDVTQKSGAGDTSYGMGCCVGDYDNDGWVDLYVTNFGPNVLYHNNGDGTFSDVTKKAGVGDEKWGAGCAFADYDRDGHIDLFVANYVDFRFENNPTASLKGIRMYSGPESFNGLPDVLYKNNGDGTFTDVTDSAGLFTSEGKGLGVVWGDYDNDGYADLFVANDRTPNFLYHNNGDGTFMDVALFAGVAYSEDGVAFNGMGANFGDYDNDGYLDIVVTNFQDQTSNLHRNTKDGFFSDVTSTCGLGKWTLPSLTWGVDFIDCDNDGYQDIFAVNGHIDENIDKVDPIGVYAQQNQLFRNNRDGTFTDVSKTAGAGLSVKMVSRGAAFGDYDNDGDVDVLVTNLNQPPTLLKNEGGNKNHWLTIKTVGTKSNRDGIGVRIKLVAGGKMQIREVKSGSSYMCQSDMRVHFGLGKVKTVEEVRIQWPSGFVEKVEKIKADQFLIFTEGLGF